MSDIKLTHHQAHLAFFCMMQASCPIDSNVTNLLTQQKPLSKRETSPLNFIFQNNETVCSIYFFYVPLD